MISVELAGMSSNFLNICSIFYNRKNLETDGRFGCSSANSINTLIPNAFSVITVREVGYSETGESLLLKALGYSPKLRIIDIFLASPYFDFSKEELMRELGMSKHTLYKNFKDLEELRLIVQTRKIGRATMYRINNQNPMVKTLNKQVNALSLEIADRQLKHKKTILAAAP